MIQPYYDDGTCVIYHGDCRDWSGSVAADVVITDPPYGINYVAGGSEAAWSRRQAVSGDDSTELRDSVLTALRLPAAVFGSWKQTPPRGTRMALVWDKGPEYGAGDLALPWKPSWEMIYILGRGWKSDFRSEGVLKGFVFPHGFGYWPSQKRVHPTEKPLALMVHLLERAPDGVILDPFMGSGTTLRAAKDVGRKAIGIEVEERYCEVAAKRLAQEALDIA